MGGHFRYFLFNSTNRDMKFLSDNQFLAGIHNYERQLAKLLALLLAIVIGFAVFELVLESSVKITRFQTDWFDGGLIKLLDRLLQIFIALEVLQNVTAYLRDQVVQIELVLLTAMTAVARKVIVLPPGTESKPQLMAGFGVIVVGLAAAYWLVIRVKQHHQPAVSQEGN
jgi:uncharacterized membrane protein (DUF373 family)